MGYVATTVKGWQNGVASCANCTAATIELQASNETELSVRLIASNGEVAEGIFTAGQLYDLARLGSDVLVAQSEALRARKS